MQRRHCNMKLGKFARRNFVIWPSDRRIKTRAMEGNSKEQAKQMINDRDIAKPSILEDPPTCFLGMDGKHHHCPLRQYPTTTIFSQNKQSNQLLCTRGIKHVTCLKRKKKAWKHLVWQNNKRGFSTFEALEHLLLDVKIRGEQD